MRFIDADELLEQYNLKDATKYGNKAAEKQAHSYSTMMLYEIADMIEDAPTAYDVENVVEQFENDEKHTFDGCINKRYAIGIVKGGGVNG